MFAKRYMYILDGGLLMGLHNIDVYVRIQTFSCACPGLVASVWVPDLDLDQNQTQVEREPDDENRNYLLFGAGVWRCLHAADSWIFPDIF